MKLKDLINIMRLPHKIELRDEDDYYICTTLSDRKGVEPYLETEVIQWFAIDNCKVMLRIKL